MAHRACINQPVKVEFASQKKPHLVRWDGKRLTDTTTVITSHRKKNIERLSVVVTGVETEDIRNQ